MSHPLSFLKASDGTAAAGMTVAIVGSWVACKIGQPVSIQIVQAAGPVGVWTLQGTNEDPAVFGSAATTVSSSLYWTTPAQPAGSAACVTSIVVQATHENMRPYYTPASGGTGIVPTGLYGLGAGGVVVIPPDVAISPASSFGAINAILADSAELAAIAASATVAGSALTGITMGTELLATADIGALNGRGAALGCATLDSAGKLAQGIPSGIVLTGPVIDGEPSTVAKQAALTSIAATQMNSGYYELIVAAADFDVTLDSDTKGGWQMFFEIFCAGTSAQTLKLRINEDYSNTNKSWWGNYQPNGGWLGNNGENPGVAGPNAASGIAGTVVKIAVSCPQPSSVGGGARVLTVKSSTYTNPTTKAAQIINYEVLYSGTDDIAKIGLHTSLASGMAAGSNCRWSRL